MAKPDAIQYDKDGNEMAHWRFNPSAPKQEPYGYFRYDIKLDAWVQNKESTQGVAFYTHPPQRTEQLKACVYCGQLVAKENT
jgi:hypothetical protein